MGAHDGHGAMLAVEEHLATILEAARLLEAEELPLALAGGATLREPVRAAVPIPPFRNSAMDGFAVRFADVAAASAERPAVLDVAADLPAGSAEDPPLAPGRAARIMTGAAVPSDADTVVPFEDTAGGLADSLDTVSVLRPPRALGAHVRLAGEDADVGDAVLPAGVALGGRQLAAAAAANVASLVVSRRPRVVVISTGDELVEPGESLPRGRIPESNGHLLAELARQAGAEVVLRASVDDAGDGLRETLAEGRGADVAILTGGVSAGAYEVVRNELTGVMAFSRVAMQPGKPQAFGVAGGTALFGLPGNPVSVAVSFEVFVRPFLLALQGRSRLHRRVIRLPTTSGWRTPPGRRQYLPVAIEGDDPADWTVRAATGGGSHLVAGLALADAYAILPAEVERVSPGELVDVMLLEDG